MKEIRIMVVVDGWGNQSNRVNNIMQDLWFEMAGEYANLEHIFIADATENPDLINTLKIGRLPAVIFMTPEDPEKNTWRTTGRLEGEHNEQTYRQALENALEGGKEPGEDQIVQDGDVFGGGLGWFDNPKVAWLALLLLGGFIILRR